MSPTAILVVIDSPVGWGEGKTTTFEHSKFKTAFDLPDLAAGNGYSDMSASH